MLADLKAALPFSRSASDVEPDAASTGEGGAGLAEAGRAVPRAPPSLLAAEAGVDSGRLPDAPGPGAGDGAAAAAALAFFAAFFSRSSRARDCSATLTPSAAMVERDCGERQDGQLTVPPLSGDAFSHAVEHGWQNVWPQGQETGSWNSSWHIPHVRLLMLEIAIESDDQRAIAEIATEKGFQACIFANTGAKQDQMRLKYNND